jgi:hypothetical protein
LRAGATVTSSGLKAFCIERGPLYSHPRHIAVVSALLVAVIVAFLFARLLIRNQQRVVKAEQLAAEAADESISQDDTVTGAEAEAVEAQPVDVASDEVEPRTTQVTVTGLVSVASIASFKRQLARLPGVASVAVASGPDGEFVFYVTHDVDVAFRDVIPTMPGFGARVTATGDNALTVTARDPEAEG